MDEMDVTQITVITVLRCAEKLRANYQSALNRTASTRSRRNARNGNGTCQLRGSRVQPPVKKDPSSLLGPNVNSVATQKC